MARTEFERVADTLLASVPGMALATDIICGFPGGWMLLHLSSLQPFLSPCLHLFVPLPAPACIGSCPCMPLPMPMPAQVRLLRTGRAPWPCAASTASPSATSPSSIPGGPGLATLGVQHARTLDRPLSLGSAGMLAAETCHDPEYVYMRARMPRTPAARITTWPALNLIVMAAV